MVLKFIILIFGTSLLGKYFFIFFISFLSVTSWYTAWQVSSFRKYIEKWCEINCLNTKEFQLDYKFYRKDPFLYTTGLWQVMFLVDVQRDGKQYKVWFLFGNWFLGGVSKKVRIEAYDSQGCKIFCSASLLNKSLDKIDFF